MKTAKYFTGIMLLAVFNVCLASLRIVPVDVVMIEDELFFVLEKEHRLTFVEVSEAKAAPGSASKSFWLLGYDVSTPVKSRKYLKLQQIRYGQRFKEFQITKGPVELQKNVEYSVLMRMGGSFAMETFVITSDNKVIMPHPRFERQKSRTYSVSVDKGGNKTLRLCSRWLPMASRRCAKAGNDAWPAPD